jgi:hypothetical protein
MIWRWPSQNTFGIWTVLYWTRSSRTEFSGSGDWQGTLWTLFVTFCIVIIRCTKTSWSPCNFCDDSKTNMLLITCPPELFVALLAGKTSSSSDSSSSVPDSSGVISAARVAAISNHIIISDQSSYLSVYFCIFIQSAPTSPADNFLSLRCQKLTTVDMRLDNEKTKCPLKL